MRDLVTPPESQQKFFAGIARDRDFRVHAETVGDVMHTVLEQLRLRRILGALPPLSVELLWLMLELVDMPAFDVENRIFCDVSLGYLHDATGREPKSVTDRPSKKRNTGHITRAIKPLVELGIVQLVFRGNGIEMSRYEIFLPKTTGTLRRMHHSRGRGCAGATPLSAPARSPDEIITRAGAAPYSAPAHPRIARQRAMRVRAGASPRPIPYIGSAAVPAAAAELKGGKEIRPQGWRPPAEAVDLLVAQKVSKPDAEQILSHPKVRIADHLVCDVIKRIAATPSAKSARTPGAWWMSALSNHHRFGPDPVAEHVAKARESRRSAPEDGNPTNESTEHFEVVGGNLVRAMTDEEIAATREALVKHLMRMNKVEGAFIIEQVKSPRTSKDFWKAVAKNQHVLCPKPAVPSTV